MARWSVVERGRFVLPLPPSVWRCRAAAISVLALRLGALRLGALRLGALRLGGGRRLRTGAESRPRLPFIIPRLFRSCALLLVLTNLAATVFGQAGDPGQERDLLVGLFREFSADHVEWWFLDGGRRAAVLVGRVSLETDSFRLVADRAAISSGPGAGEYRLFASGAIVLSGEERSFRGETVVVEGRRDGGETFGRAVLTDVRVRVDREWISWLGRRVRTGSWRQVGRTALEAAPPRTPPGGGGWGQLVVAAEELTTEDLRSLSGRSIDVTTCEFGEPHWSVSAQSGSVQEVPRTLPGGAAGRSHLARLQGVRFRLWGWPILPLPSVSWDTHWGRSFPLRSVAYSNSSSFGQRVDTVWNGNLLLPSLLRSRLNLELRADYLSKRGTGYGADAEFGRAPSSWAADGSVAHYGVATGYALRDRGTDRGDTVPERRDRARFRWHHRLRLPTATLVDLEHAVERDRGFLEEYFEEELRGEKTPENLVYVRQAAGEEIALTLLTKARWMRSRSVTERLPELSLFAVERPIGGSGVSLDLVARGGRSRFQPNDRTALRGRQIDRGDLLATVAYERLGHARWGRLRPFVEVRGTAWSEDLAGDPHEERFSVATGARLGWHLARTFSFSSARLGIDRLHHAIDPEVSYRLLFENNVDPGELYAIDEAESVARMERLTFDVRQFLFGRGSRSTDGPEQTPPSKLAEFDARIDYFPDAARDNGGNNWGLLESELLVHPYPGVRTFLESTLDVENEGRFVRFEPALGVTLPGGASFAVGNRYTRHASHSLDVQGVWVASPRYEFRARYQRDWRRRRDTSHLYSLIRHFHRWSMMCTFEVDEGEDDVSFQVRFGPRDWIGLLVDDHDH